MYSLLRSFTKDQPTHNPLVAGSSPACPTFLNVLRGMLEGKTVDYFIDFTNPSPPTWTTSGPLDDNKLQKTTINPSEVTANPNNQEGGYHRERNR